MYWKDANTGLSLSRETKEKEKNIPVIGITQSLGGRLE